MRNIDAIVIHCSASKDGVAKSREQLEAEHKARGFRTIGYHYVVEPDGTLMVCRPEADVGAHVEGHNATTIGVCMIGTQKWDRRAWDTLRSVVGSLKRKYPKARVCGHRDFSPDLNKNGKVDRNEWIKLCPNFDVATWVKTGTPEVENVI